MIENRRGLTIFSHTMLILGIVVILFRCMSPLLRRRGQQSGF
jgi:hypothetical protein